MSAEEAIVEQAKQEVERVVEEAAKDAIVEAVAEAVTQEDAPMQEVTVTETTTQNPNGETLVTTEVTTTDPVTEETPSATVAETPQIANGASSVEPLDPNDPLSLPPYGTEVFIGGIPKTVPEADIRTFASKIGEVHSVRMSYDPSNPGQNRGYGFVRYFKREHAEEAKQKLHETKLEGIESKLRVSDSQAKYRIYLGNLPRSWSKDQLTDEINKISKGLESIDLVMSKDYPNQNRGFAFLTFYNSECAALAKETLSKATYKMEGKSLTVSFAEPKQTLQEQQATPAKSKACYVGGLPPGVTDEKIKEIFTKYGEVLKVVIPPATEKRPEQRFCFVHYVDQSGADNAVSASESGEKPVYDTKALEVKAARPQDSRPEPRQPYEATFSPYAGGRGGRGGFGPGRGGPGPGPRGGRIGGRFGGRGGRGQNFGRGPPPGQFQQTPPFDQSYGGYEQQGYGYEQGYAQNYGYDQGGYDQGYDQGYSGYDQYGEYANAPQQVAPVQAQIAQTPISQPGQAGMTMVPMMLPSGQVGYVLQEQSSQQGGEYGSYAPGPDRGYSNGRGRGRGPPRYRPY